MASIIPRTYSRSFYVVSSDHNLAVHPKSERLRVSYSTGYNSIPNPNPNSGQESNSHI